MTKITTKTLSRYKSLFTVLLALLLLVVAAAPVSATLIVWQGIAGSSDPGANYNNATAGNLSYLLPMTHMNSTDGTDFAVGNVIVTVPVGSSFNTTPGYTPWTTVKGVTVGSMSLYNARTYHIPVTIAGVALSEIAINNLYVDTATSGWATTGIGTMTFTGNGPMNSTAIGFNVSHPQVVFSAVNVTPGSRFIAGPTIYINSTSIVTSATNTFAPDGEIGVGTVSITLTGNSGILFNATFPGTAVVNTQRFGSNATGLNVTPSAPVVSADRLTLTQTVDRASNSSSQAMGGALAGNNQSITFSGFYLDVPSTAVANAKTNFTIKTTPTSGLEVSQVTAPVLTVVQPAINFAGVNATVGGRFNLGNPISVNSTFGHPDGEIGNGTVSITLPDGCGITFNSTFNGTVAVSKTANAVQLNLTPGNPIVSNYGKTLSVTVNAASNSTSAASAAVVANGGPTYPNQSITFSGFYLDIASTATVGNTYNFTISTTPTNGTAILQTYTTFGITIVKPNVTYAGITYTSNGVANTSVGLAPLAINSTFGHPDGEIGNGTVSIALDTYASSAGITFNRTDVAIAKVSKTANAVALNLTPFAGQNAAGDTIANLTSNGLTLFATVDAASNSTSAVTASAGATNQSITFSGWNLSMPANVPAGNYNFTITTTPTNGTACVQTVTAVTVTAGTPSSVYPVSPNGIYEDPVVLVVGTTSTFNWTVLNGTFGIANQVVNFATNGTASWLNTSSMTSSATGNVSVKFTAPTVIPASGITAGYNLTATVNGYPLVVNTTNIKVINQTWATRLKIFPDVTRYAPNGIANITVWAQDSYGNNQTTNSTSVRLSSSTQGVFFLTAATQTLIGGNCTWQIKSDNPGSIALTVQNDSASPVFPAATATQTFIGDIGSIGMTTTSSSLIANGQEANLTVQLYDLNGAAMLLSGATVTFATNNITPNVTAPITVLSQVTATTALTDTNGKAYAYIKANSAGVIGTLYANVTVINQSATTLTGPVLMTLTVGVPSDATSTLTASPTAPNAGATSTISALIKDVSSNVISGATVNFAITTPGGSLSAASNVTNAAGYANVTLTTNTTAGTNTVTATTGAVSKTVNVITTVGTATKLGFTTDTPSTIGVGLTGTIKAQLLDINGNLVPTTGTTVNFANGNTAAGTLSATSATTLNGVASVILTGSATGGSTLINASSGTLESALKTITVQRVGGIAMTVSKNLAAANGSDTITLTSQLIDAAGAKLPIPGQLISYINSTGVTMSANSGTTDANGAHAITLTSSTVGKPTVTAYTTGAQNTSPVITFSGPAVAMVVTPDPTSTTVNSLITVRVQAVDASGNSAVNYNGVPITGQPVTFSSVSALVVTNNTNFGATGAASATVTSATVDTYTMTIVAIGTSKTATVTFTAPTVDTVGVFRAGSFYLKDATAFGYGLTGDTPFAGDWDGSGVDTGGVFRNGSFYPYGATAYSYGIRGDQPFSINWTGSAASETGVFRDGIFFIRNMTDGSTYDWFYYGAAGDLPIAGDWNGDRVDEVGVFRDGSFYLRAHDGSTYDAFGYGLTGDRPVAGDWNGDGKTEVGVFRDGSFYLRAQDGTTYSQFAYGLTGDLPIAGKWI